ncbi:MAG: hypothetical protein IKN75_06610 [Prevotella sp.]|nr:hypothetical protein [Prevotella sp.]
MQIPLPSQDGECLRHRRAGVSPATDNGGYCDVRHVPSYEICNGVERG